MSEADYTIPATSITPVLIIYLLDISGSMQLPLDSGKASGTKRIEVINNALEEIAIKMTERSMKGAMVSPRYRLALYGYNTEVYDLLQGIRGIDEVVRDGVPELREQDAKGHTQTAKAFAVAEGLLQRELPHLQDCPAPIVCHMTDGEYDSDSDPREIAKRIRQLRTADGPVLIENIFISDRILKHPVRNISQWPGISPNGSDFHKNADGDYARTLMTMSSPLPASFAEAISDETGYALESGRPMMYPGQSLELVRLAFTVSGSSPIRGIED